MGTDISTYVQNDGPSLLVVEDDDESLEPAQPASFSAVPLSISQSHQQPNNGKRPISNGSDTSHRVWKRVRDGLGLVAETLAPESNSSPPMLDADSSPTFLITSESSTESGDSLFSDEATNYTLEEIDQLEPEDPPFDPKSGQIRRLTVEFSNPITQFSPKFDLPALQHTADVFLTSQM